MTLKEIFDENVKTESVFNFPWYVRSFKMNSVGVEDYKLVAWHCPRVEVSNLVKDESLCLIDDRSVFDAGSDKGEGIAVYDPSRVKLEFINGDPYSPNVIIFKRV